ncbi:uncharacterized protein [Hetaerina americana]|uniref:uncharacterized protein n=1 Tax=Hetaerina americana TaxID=62018 RepID=UPI003A7F4B3F
MGLGNRPDAVFHQVVIYLGEGGNGCTGYGGVTALTGATSSITYTIIATDGGATPTYFVLVSCKNVGLGKTAFLTLFLTSGVNGQVIRVGACPTPTLSRPQAAPAAPNFLSGDMRRVWYVVRHTRPVLGPQLVCRQFRFSLETPAVAPALQTILVDISGVNWFIEKMKLRTGGKGRSCATVIYLIVLQSLLPDVVCEKFGFGLCPSTTPATGAAAGTLIGTWYNTQKYYFSLDPPLKCMKYEITMAPNSADLTVKKSTSNIITGLEYSETGTLTPVGTSFNRYLVLFPFHVIFPKDYILLGFSANNFAVLFTCLNVASVYHIQNVVVLTTAPVPTATTLQAIGAVLAANNIPTWLLSPVIKC